MPFGKHRVLGQSTQENVREDPELIGKAITIGEAKEIGRMAGADGMQTAIRQYRQTEIILARPRQEDSRSSKRECILPCPTSTHSRPSFPLQQAVRVSEAHLETPCKTCKERQHVQTNPKRRARPEAAAALAPSGHLQRSCRGKDEGSARAESHVKGRGIYQLQSCCR